MPKENPGPGTYDIVNIQSIENLHRSKAMEPGWTFPGGPKDAISTEVSKNINPGPGAHDPIFPKSGTSKRILGGSLANKELVDNGVPGPGTYQPDS